MKDTDICIVTNRSAGRVVYSIPELHVRRTFAPGESQKIEYGELVKLTYQPGGKNLIVSFLQVQSEEALKSFNMNVQPEYFMTREQIADLLKTGSFDAFLDCLDYAPTGVIDILKEVAIELPLSDYNKRQALKEKLGYDVDKILENKKAEAEEEKNPGGFVADKTSSTTATTAPASTGRRTKITYKAPAPTTTTVKK